MPLDEAERRLQAYRKKSNPVLAGVIGLRWLFDRQHRTALPRASDGHTRQLEVLAADIAGHLEGRKLLHWQIAAEVRRRGLWPADVEAAIDYGGWIQLWQCRAGVGGSIREEAQCRRCGSYDIALFPCSACGRSDCPVCLCCQTLGMVRGCTPLLQLQSGEAGQSCRPVRLQLEFRLTSAQAAASRFLTEWLCGNQPLAVVWAACGAGKTETVFAAMQRVLMQGGQVLFAIPRRDVVAEMEARLRKAFPDVPLAVLYGGRKDSCDVPLIAATTHQVLRFHRRFDLVVLDEVDAFPYHGSEMLRYGMDQAVKEGGKRIEMTATPISWPVRVPSVTIPARHHGYALPEPVLIRWNQSLSSGPPWRLPPSLVGIMRDSRDPWILFCPTRKTCESVAAWFQDCMGIRTEFCHSQSQGREGLLERLKTGQLKYAAATSVLERGITVPGVQVVVLWADHDVFSARSLVQMAGRVGRTAAKPKGMVWFAAKGWSGSMREAKRRIQFLNSQAAEQGLLTGGELQC